MDGQSRGERSSEGWATEVSAKLKSRARAGALHQPCGSPGPGKQADAAGGLGGRSVASVQG
jgi:hypothetical protein